MSNVNNWILSYPRSGNHLVRYMIEFMTKQATLGCRGNESIDTPIRDRSGVMYLRDVSNTPIARKAHAAVEIDVMNARSIILILRNPVDAVISHKIPQTDYDHAHLQKHGITSTGTDAGDFRKWVHTFMKNLELYESFEGKKALIKYEELISDTAYKKPISLIADIFDVNKENLDYTLANYLNLRSDSLDGPFKTPQSVDSTGKVWLTRSQLLKKRDPGSYEKIVNSLKDVLEHDIVKRYYGSIISEGNNE